VLHREHRKNNERIGRVNIRRYISILNKNQVVGAECVFEGTDNRDVVITGVVDERSKEEGSEKLY